MNQPNSTNPFEYYPRTRIVFGSSAIERVGDLAPELRAHLGGCRVEAGAEVLPPQVIGVERDAAVCFRAGPQAIPDPLDQETAAPFGQLGAQLLGVLKSGATQQEKAEACVFLLQSDPAEAEPLRRRRISHASSKTAVGE